MVARRRFLAFGLWHVVPLLLLGLAVALGLGGSKAATPSMLKTGRDCPPHGAVATSPTSDAAAASGDSCR